MKIKKNKQIKPQVVTLSHPKQLHTKPKKQDVIPKINKFLSIFMEYHKNLTHGKGSLFNIFLYYHKHY